MNSYFEFINSVKLLCGDAALERLPFEMQQLGGHKAMLLTDAILAKIGSLDAVQSALAGALDCFVYTDIPVDSSLSKVNELVSLYHERGCDCMIALGGGSVIDTAKGVRLVLSQKSDDLMSFCGAESLKRGLAIPFAVIPTTAGTGSECTGVAVIKNEETSVKMEFVSPFNLPDIAILDPSMTLSLPPKATASTGLDALCHAIEAHSCLQANPLSSAYALSAIKLIAQYLPIATAKPKNKLARGKMAVASCMAGVAFSNSMVGLVHAIGHVVGAQCRVPHAVVMAILLPHVMRYNLKVCAEAYAEILPFFSPVAYASCAQKGYEEQALACIHALEMLLDELHESSGLPRSLAEVGVREDQYTTIATDAIHDGAIIYNPCLAGVEDICAILKQAQ